MVNGSSADRALRVQTALIQWGHVLLPDTATGMTSTVSAPARPRRLELGSSRVALSAVRWQAVTGGLFAAAVSAAGSWIPSFWGDEGASVMSAERSWPQLFVLLGHVDAVHGSYYALLHVWIRLFGASELSARTPSALAVGAAAAGVVVLVRRFVSPRVAGISVLLFAVLPRVTYMGEEARSQALSAAAAVWATVAFVHALERGGRRAWLGYAVVLAAADYVFLYTGLVAVAHACALLLSGSPRRTLARWAAATGLALALSAPLVYWSFRERSQVAFLETLDVADPQTMLVSPWFGSIPLAVLGWPAVGVAGWRILRAVRSRSERGRRDGGARARRAGIPPDLGTLALAGTIVPPAIVLLVNVVHADFTSRYLSFCTPFVAILLALAVAAVPSRALAAALTAALVGTSLVTYAEQRTPYAKDGGSDWSAVASEVGAHGRPGDAVVFDERVKADRRPRVAEHLYPDDFAGLLDVTLRTPYERTTGLWDRVRPLSAARAELASVPRVWVLRAKQHPLTASDPQERELRRDGFTPAAVFPVHRTVIYELTRGTP